MERQVSRVTKKDTKGLTSWLVAQLDRVEIRHDRLSLVIYTSNGPASGASRVAEIVETTREAESRLAVDGSREIHGRGTLTESRRSGAAAKERRDARCSVS